MYIHIDHVLTVIQPIRQNGGPQKLQLVLDENERKEEVNRDSYAYLLWCKILIFPNLVITT